MYPERKAALMRRDKLQAIVDVLNKVDSTALNAKERETLDAHKADMTDSLQVAEKRVKEKSTWMFCEKKSVGGREVDGVRVESRYTTEKDLDGNYWSISEVQKRLPSMLGIRSYSNIVPMEHKSFKTRMAAQNHAEREFAKLTTKYHKPAKVTKSKAKTKSDAPKLTDSEKKKLSQQNQALNRWANKNLLGGK